MGRQFEGSKLSFVAAAPPATAIPFIHRLALSGAFKDLFREGMALVEEAASYLDGPGRVESRALPRPAGLAYSTESMRLTTRLMQVASWLLLQRAVNEGELTSTQAQAERIRVKLSRQEFGCARRDFRTIAADPAQSQQAVAPHSGTGHPSRSKPCRRAIARAGENTIGGCLSGRAASGCVFELRGRPTPGGVFAGLSRPPIWPHCSAKMPASHTICPTWS